MKISKILNNNAVISKDKDGNETVIMGKGIAFKRKVDEYIDDSKIEKTYVFSPGNTKEIIKLFSSIPDIYIEVTTDIINLAEMTLGKNLSKNLYISLTDHIFSAITRLEDGISFTNPLLWDIKRFYINEYEVALESINIIKEKIDIELPEDEAGFIALHLVNAQLDQNENSVYEITGLIQDILKIIRMHFGIEFDEDSINYYRFITHLRFFAQRVVKGKFYDEGKIDDLYLIIKNNYKESHNAASKIRDFINSKYKYNLNNEEELYLTIHIEKVVNKK